MIRVTNTDYFNPISLDKFSGVVAITSIVSLHSFTIVVEAGGNKIPNMLHMERSVTGNYGKRFREK